MKQLSTWSALNAHLLSRAHHFQKHPRALHLRHVPLQTPRSGPEEPLGDRESDIFRRVVNSEHRDDHAIRMWCFVFFFFFIRIRGSMRTRWAFIRALQVSCRGSLLDAMILEIGELTPVFWWKRRHLHKLYIVVHRQTFPWYELVLHVLTACCTRLDFARHDPKILIPIHSKYILFRLACRLWEKGR